MRLVLLLALLGALAAPATAAAQTPGIPPPGANDFSCRSTQHPEPVILVHGTFGDMTVSWNALSPLLVGSHYCVFALDLVNRGMAPIDQSADKLAAFIDEVRERTGAAKVSLVGHSQGGMLGRYVARFRGKLGVIDDIVGLAPSSHGTTRPLAPPLGNLGCPACAEQAAGSDFMKKLNSGQEAPPPPSYTVVSTKYDEVVTPYTSQALTGSTVTNVVLQDRCPDDVTDHVGIIYDPIALQWVLNALGRPGPADPAFEPPCRDAVGGAPPQAFATARKPRVSRHRIAVRVTCASGPCVGRVVLRDRRGRLGTKAFKIPSGRTRTVRVHTRRRPARKITARVLTLQPGGSSSRRSSTGSVGSTDAAGGYRPGAMPALILDLDGTLVDTVYGHVFAWQRALAQSGMPIDGWKIHRRVGMSGGLFTRAIGRELGRDLTDEEAKELQDRHGQLFRELLPERRPLPGARAMLADLRERGVTHGIATSGRRPEINASLDALGVPESMVVVERGDVARAKPEPDLFVECARRLGADPADCYVIGDAVWDLLAARRAGMLSVGLLSGGYGSDELERAGAYRVYRDAAELHISLDELGIA